MVKVDTRKIRAWNQFYPVFTKGRVVPGNRRATTGQGNAPFRVMFVDEGRRTGLPLTTGPADQQGDRALVERADEQGLRR